MAKTILSGILGPVALADLFSLLNLAKKTGCLTCSSRTLIKKVFWEEGEVVFARSNLRDDSLGNFLVDHGIITAKQKEASFRQIQAGERHGKVLVRLGHITPEQLLWAVRNQVQEIVYGLFLWETGRFQFDEGPLEIREKVTLSASTTRVVMEGIRRMDEWKRIQETIPDLQAAPRRTEKDPGEEDLPAEDRKLLALANGSRSFDAIRGEAGIGSFEALCALQRLLAAGYLRISPAPAGDREDMVFRVVGNP